ncbi:MAG: 1-acyl-sn-glycerol-3-phosphate acyltransferase [Treponema sp.]|jgi:1-acyl-sn-glycerol-3-phosphate acyltransferase|nr:1-acyl-sn-glycerol-3-phosphate acyltransferase [Treponema sp.]
MKALYRYHVAAKWFSFFIFGVGTLILVTAFFPVMRLFLHPRRRFQKSARSLVSFVFRFFVGIMTALRIVELRPGDRRAYRKLGGKIAAANHPSLLDVVMLIALIPNADCIVRGSLTRTIMRGIIRQLYIPNSGNAEKLIGDCVASIREGNCIIIFPEGTRTPRAGGQKFKKGAVRIALAARCPIVPIRIGGTDKFGLGKKDPWTAFNPTEKYVYRLEILDELTGETWADMNTALAVRRWNEALYRALFS